MFSRREFLGTMAAGFVDTCAPKSGLLPPSGLLSGPSTKDFTNHDYQWKAYELRDHVVHLSKPRIAYQAPRFWRAKIPTAEKSFSKGMKRYAGAFERPPLHQIPYTHFAGMNRFPDTGTICLRVNTGTDEIEADAGGLHILSKDNGWSFDTNTSYVVSGSHTSAEPLVWDVDAFVGGTFAPKDFKFASLDRKSVKCARWTLGDDGASYTSEKDGVLFTGFPRAIGNYVKEVGVAWFGTIVALIDGTWVTTIPVTYQGDVRSSTECFYSNDKGRTWWWVGSLPPGPNEGVDEGTMILLPDQRLMFVSRIGVGRIVRSFSSDYGRTWEPLVHLSPWCLAPYLHTLKGTQDYVIMTGHVSKATVWPDGADINGAVPFDNDWYAPAQSGLYVSRDPEARSWQFVDIVDHHNETIDDPNLMISTDWPIHQPTMSGYMTTVDVDPEGNHILFNYDRGASQTKDGDQGNQIFVVDGLIERR